MSAGFVIAFFLVALAELGDKTQLLVLAFAARYRTRTVIAGVAVAVLALQFVAVAAGRLVGALLPERAVAFAAGALFVGFGVWTWRGARGPEEAPASGGSLGAFLAVASGFFLAELGDKTQLMTVSIAADPAAALRTLDALLPGVTVPALGGSGTLFGVWLGSSLGMLVADGAALAVGAALGARLPERTIRRSAAVVFVLFGAATLASAFLGP